MKRFQNGVSVLLAILVILSSVATWAVFAEGEFALTAVDGTAGNSGEGLDKLFDGDLESKYCTMNDTAYVVAKLSSAQPINAYSLTSADQSARDPAAWVFYGSNDGESWTELDSRSEETFAMRWWTNTYYFENETSYMYYKLSITENQGIDPYGYDILALAELSVAISEPEEDKRIYIDSSTAEGTEGNGSHSIDKLFDGILSTKYLVMDKTAAVWFSLNKATAINCYKLTSGDDQPARDPSAWTFYGSNDGANWTELDSRSGESFAQRNFEMVYYFENTTEYLWFKLDITGNNGVDDFGLDILQLAELSVAVEDSQEDTRILVDTATIQATEANSTSESAEKLFDGNISTKYLTKNSSAEVIFALTAARAINTYTMTCTTDWASRYPTAWTFYGSADGTDWVELDRRSGEGAVAISGASSYTFENTVEYKWFKLEISDNGGNTYTGLAEFSVSISDSPAVTDRQVFVQDSTVTATEPYGSNPASSLFDGQLESSRYLVAGTSATVTFALTNAAAVNRYILFSANDHSERTPSDFTLSASNDGESWVVLDEQTGAAWGTNDLFCGHVFSFENSVAYKWYKLEVTAVRSGSYLALSELSLFASSPSEGADIYIPSGVESVAGVLESSVLRSLILKNTLLGASDAVAFDSLGALTVYCHKRTDGMDTVASSLAGKENVTVKNLLSVVTDVTVGVKAGKNIVTGLGCITAEDLDYETLSLVMTFKEGDKIVRQKEIDVRSVYKTISGYATTNADIATVLGIDFVEGSYLFGLSVCGVPAGAYDVEVQAVGTVKGADGTLVEVCSEVYTESVTVPAL